MAWSSSSESGEQTPAPPSPGDGCAGTGTFAEFLIARQYGGQDLLPSVLLTPAQCGHCGRLEDLRCARSSMLDTGSSIPEVSPPFVDQIAFEGNSCFSCVKMIYQKIRWLDQEGGGPDSGDTPVHYAARSRNLRMLFHFICLVGDEYGQEGAAVVLRKLNGRKETALHEAIKLGNICMAGLLMWVDPKLAQYPAAGEGTSPLYLAVSLRLVHIAQMLYRKSGYGTYLSYSGPDGQNALHVDVLHTYGMMEMLLDWNKDLSKEKDRNGSTPLHFVVSAPYKPYIRLCRFRFPGSRFPLENCPTWHVLDANPSAAYEPDNNGLFPLHIAALMDRIAAFRIIVKRCPGCIGLRDKRGRTFLHIALQEKSFNVVRYACQESAFASVMNAQDNDGNTALHLAVEAGELYVASALLGNLEVLINLWNNKNQTPLDLAKCQVSAGFSNNWNQENMIYRALKIAGGEHGSKRWDYFQEINAALAKQEDDEKVSAKMSDSTKQEDDENEPTKMSDSTKGLGIISPLIASATFGAIFAIPAGLQARDTSKSGTRRLFGMWSFNVFMVAITLAFILSLLSTISLVFSGIPSVKFPIRRKHLTRSFVMMRASLTCLTVAFGLGLYMVLTPFGQPTNISVASMFIYSVPLSLGMEFILNISIVTLALRARRGFWVTCRFVVWSFVEEAAPHFVLVMYIVIFGTFATAAAHQKQSGLL